METSVEDVFCLEIPEICQPRFSSTLCLYVCRSDSNFIQFYFKRENFCYLNSTQCWSMANQNKSLWLSFPVIIFFLYKRCFFWFFLWACFFKRAFNSIQRSVIIEKQYLIIRIPRSDSQVLKNLLNGGKIHEIDFPEIWKNAASEHSRNKIIHFYEIFYFLFFTSLV